MNQPDSSDLPNIPDTTKSSQPSNVSINQSYRQAKLQLLESYRVEAEKLWKHLVDTYNKDASVLELHNAMLMLLIPIQNGAIQQAYKSILSDILDAELRLNGILPIQEEQKVAGSVPPSNGSESEINNFEKFQSDLPS